MSDQLKEGHMTWIIFQQCSCLETNPCYFLTNPSLTLKETEQLLLNLEHDSLLSTFYDYVRTKKSMNGVYRKQILTALLFGEW